MSVPGVPGAHLIVVESDFVLAGSETFFDGPPRPGHVDQFSESRVMRVVAVVEGQFAVIDGTTDHVLVVGVDGIDQCPVVDAEAFRSDTAGTALPCMRAQPPGEG